MLSPVQLAPVAPPPTVLHAFREAAARAPERTALAYFDGRIGYAEADELSDSVAGHLAARGVRRGDRVAVMLQNTPHFVLLSDSVAGHLAARGVRRGDRVAVMLQNTPHFVLAVLGAWKAGAVVVPLNPMYKTGEVGHVLRDSGAAALVCEARAWTAYLRQAARGTAVRTVLTASDRDFQTRDDPRVFGPPPARPAAPDQAPGPSSARPPAPAPGPIAAAAMAPAPIAAAAMAPGPIAAAAMAPGSA
ncbi:AMP-binding protein, partial [Streptomyces sp. F8]|uniref:AMP-binding protein n=1 Tax=Streptomyces sp. F8 TaxID=1436085 RepID=UPI0029CCA0F5